MYVFLMYLYILYITSKIKTRKTKREEKITKKRGKEEKAMKKTNRKKLPFYVCFTQQPWCRITVDNASTLK